tara:strand:- start:213 stop:407 length:195 start_codon:yes stop_codon:yes gene_type:complete
MAGKEEQLKAMQNRESEQLAQLPLNPMPKLPADVRKRFPSLANWEKDVVQWVKELNTVRGVGKN